MDSVGEVEGEAGVPISDTERLERHGKRVWVGEWRGELDGCEGGESGIGTGMGIGSKGWGILSAVDGDASVGVGGINDRRGEGDRER